MGAASDLAVLVRLAARTRAMLAAAMMREALVVDIRQLVV